MTSPTLVSRALTPVGNLFALGASVVRMTFKRPFQLGEFIEQTWFVTKVSALPTALFTIPFGATIALRDSSEMIGRGGSIETTVPATSTAMTARAGASSAPTPASIAVRRAISTLRVIPTTAARIARTAPHAARS